ncbi:MAG: hypothetical protein H7Z18_04855 [Methylophilaceae bacterium]|nr:hypothetical protein [Methylophilaceae bacterium]
MPVLICASTLLVLARLTAKWLSYPLALTIHSALVKAPWYKVVMADTGKPI